MGSDHFNRIKLLDQKNQNMSSFSLDALASFDDLPLDKNGPPGNAWGLFGPNDELGMLNLITPETVKAAATSEIRCGIRVSLDWPLDKPKVPTFGRQIFQHQILPSQSVTMNDDAVHFNTQSSTQWDGFRHYGRVIEICLRRRSRASACWRS